MDNLFRFLLLRPASPAASEGIKQLTASFAPAGTARDLARREARAFVDRNAHATSADGMKYSGVALEVVSKLRTNRLPAPQISSIVENATGDTAAKVVNDPKFAAEETLLADSLVAMKLLSNSSCGDAPGLAVVAQGYDAIRLTAAGRDPVYLRVLSIGDFPGGGQHEVPPTGVSPRPSPPAPNLAPASNLVAELDSAITVLGTVPASGFEAGGPARAADIPPRATGVDTSMARGQGARTWLMSAAAVSALRLLWFSKCFTRRGWSSR